MYKPFPVISIEGDAHECGEQHGAGAAARVAKTIDFYLPSFVSQAKLTLEEVRERARGYGAQIETIDADIMQELKGIAAGARQKLEDVIAVNCRTELLYGSLAGTKPATECTTVVSLPEATKDGNILIGKNWDWRNQTIESVVVLRIRQRNKPALSMIVEAGMVGRDGFNEHGVLVCGNLLVSNDDRGKVGVPIPILRRRILHSLLLRSDRHAGARAAWRIRQLRHCPPRRRRNRFRDYPRKCLCSVSGAWAADARQPFSVDGCTDDRRHQVLHRRYLVSRFSRAPVTRTEDR